MQASLFAGKRTGDDRKAVIGHKYTCSLTKVLKECYRVAKKNARLIFTYHHNSAVAWKCLGTALLHSGFHVREMFPVRSEGRSGLHSYDGTIKWDSVFVCEKATPARSAEQSRESSSLIVREALSSASRWRQRIKSANLEFGDADQRSLACSFVIGLYSQRALQPEQLWDTLTAVLSQFDRRSCRADAV